MNLSSRVKITKLAGYAAAATSDVTSDSVDMAGYDGVVFVTSYGTAATDNLMHAETSLDDSSFADLAGTELGVAASDEDQWLEIARPRERYLRVICERGTSGTQEGVWAFQYRAKDQPVDNTLAGTIFGELHIAPARGTK